VLRSFAVISLVAALLAPAVARTRPRYGGTLRIETRSDPLKAPDGIARKLLFDNLVEVTSDWHTVPKLAVNWQSESANHRWVFQLRPGVRFHDSSPLTAEAVAMSLSQSCGSCGWRVRAAGDSVVITSESPMPDLPAQLARSEFAITRRDADGNPDGTGPFRFAADDNGTLFLKANDDSWQGRPFVDAVEISGGRSVRAQWLDFSVGKADLVETPAELLRSAQQEHMPLAQSEMPVDLLALTLSEQRIPDQHLRESIALAVDRAAMFNVIFQKQGEFTGSLLPSDLTAYGFLFPTAPNVQRARELRGGQSPALRLAVDASNPVLQLVAERVALNLRDAGWAAQVVPQTASSHADLTLALVHLEPADRASALRQMLQKFGAALPDDASDPAALYRTEHNFLQSHTVVPLLYLPRAWGVSARVHNLELFLDGTPEIANVSLEDAK
jgi:MarR-like DNA-binding transcriptional regulator SgrR of sgrS sRNA